MADFLNGLGGMRRMWMIIALVCLGVAGLFAGLWWRAQWSLHSALNDAECMQQRLSDSFDKQRALEREQAATAERERIFGDLHDDLGAKLLTLIHTLDDADGADLARSVLQDFRDIVSRSADASGTLLQILAQIKDETEQRLGLMGVDLMWQQDDDLPDIALDSAQALHLFRIVREAVSNSLRHAHPTMMRIRARVLQHLLVLDVTDDGDSLSHDGPLGRGMVNMRRRAEELHGSIAWDAGTFGGTKVVLRFPLPGHETKDQAAA